MGRGNEPGLAGQERLRSVAGGSRTPPYLQHSSPACPDVTIGTFLGAHQRRRASSPQPPDLLSSKFLHLHCLCKQVKRVLFSMIIHPHSGFLFHGVLPAYRLTLQCSDAVSIHLSRVRIPRSHLANGPPSADSGPREVEGLDKNLAVRMTIPTKTKQRNCLGAMSVINNHPRIVNWTISGPDNDSRSWCVPLARFSPCVLRQFPHCSGNTTPLCFVLIFSSTD